MEIRYPTYLAKTGFADAPVKHPWDDREKVDYYGNESPLLQNKIARLTRRAAVAIAAGFAGWVAFRFSKLSDDPMLQRFLDAAWAGIVDWRYINLQAGPRNTLSSKDWQGPVRGPIFSTAVLLQNTLESGRRETPCAAHASYVSNLAEHVLSKPAPFKAWRKVIIDRLDRFHGYNPEDRTGLPVPREVLDPDYDYDPKGDAELIRAFLKGLDPSKNPFLVAPDEMIKAGFQGKPYSY